MAIIDLAGVRADATYGDLAARAAGVVRDLAACISGTSAVGNIPTVQCLHAEAQGWDDVLNTAYQSLREALSGPEMLPGAAEALRDAQRAWIPFRDAECLSRGNLTKGTGHFEDGAECNLRVAATRTLDLIGYGGGR